MAEWITVAEAAKLLGISERHVRNRARTKKLKARKDGKRWFIHSSLSEDTELEVYSYAEALAKEKGFSTLTEKDIERIIHESRGVKQNK